MAVAEGQGRLGDAEASTSVGLQLLCTLAGHSRAVTSVKFSPGRGSDTLATCGADKSIRLWRSTGGEALRTLEGHSQGVNDIAWDSEGRYLASASDDYTIKLWDVEAGKCLRTLQAHTNFAFCCNFSPHGNMLASGSFDETLRLWDARCGRCIKEVAAHSDPLTAVHFSADSSLLASSSLDGLVRVWDRDSGKCLKTIFDTASPPMSDVRFSPNGKYLLSSSLDSQLRLWDLEGGRPCRAYQGGHRNSELCITSTWLLLAGVPLVATGSEDGGVVVYDVQGGKVVGSMAGRTTPEDQGQGHCDAVLCVDAHPSKQLLASCAHQKDGTAKVWNVAQR